MQFILIAIIIAYAVSPLLKCVTFNLHNVCIYTVKDLVGYVFTKGWARFNEYGIRMYIGMFGHGKTLSMTQKAQCLYKKHGDSLIFYSNYTLNDIPYIPLTNFNQLVDLGEEMPEGVQGYVVLLDEISSVLSHRNYASFPLKLIGLLCQQRKKRVFIMCTAQRFFMVDKIWRSITTHVIDCHKYWRFQHMSFYDAWELENAMNTSLVRRMSHAWWFVKNNAYNAYDTSEMISKTTASDFISNEEAIVRKGLDSTVNQLAVKSPSRWLKKHRKGKG